MAPIFVTTPSRPKHIWTPYSTRKRKKASAIALELVTPVSKRFVTHPASCFPTLARSPASKSLKDFARASNHVRGTMSVRKYIAAGYRWNALRLNWRLNRPYRALSAYRYTSISPRRNVSPSAFPKLPLVSTPDSDFGGLQEDIDLLNSPSAKRLARKNASTVRKNEPGIFIDFKAPASLTDQPRRENSKIFFMKAAPSRRISQCARLVVEYDLLAKNSTLCRDVLRDKRDGTLADPTNAIVYDTAPATGQARNCNSSIQDTFIYLLGLLESDIAKAQECYDEVMALSSTILWAGLTIFLNWVRYDTIDFEKAVEEELLAACYVGSVLGAPEKFLLALDV